MTIASLHIFAGLVMLAAGGEALVRGAVGAAQRLKVSPLVTGLVLVGFGTSTPELVTSLRAALAGSPGLAVGNVIGSNIANILLILGVGAAIYPIAAELRSFKRDAPMLAVATVACVFFALNGVFERITGIAFLAMLAGYLGYTFRTERRAFDAQARLHVAEAQLASPGPGALWISTGMAVGGACIIVFGANWVVDGSITIARALGVRDTIIGLTVVAIGTSLPELASTVIAALRKQSDLAFGNILGSNLFNTLGILGITAAISPISIPPRILLYDLGVLVGVTALLLVFAFTEARLSRREGAAFLGLYALYIGFLGVRAAGAV